ncbi:MAG: hypothetical protein FD153_1625 [Rhodospirillaceae bacterium]|nr:MAG: hypothetical protein FD153_1625 [Rhodospirillaceae bacterium]
MPEIGPVPKRRQEPDAHLTVTAVSPIAFRVRDAARYIGISPTALWRLLHDGVLPRVTIGRGCTVVPRLALDALIAAEAPGRALGRKKQP